MCPSDPAPAVQDKAAGQATEAPPAEQPTTAGAGSLPTCGTCGRACLPDGDCYGCEADRWIARAAAIDVERTTWRAQAEALAGALVKCAELFETIRQETRASTWIESRKGCTICEKALARLPAHRP